MSDYIAVIALAAFIGTIVVWNVLFKRNIGEAMFAGFIVSALFAGTDFPSALWIGLMDGLMNEVTYAALAFVVVGELLVRVGIVQRIVDVLSSMIGRFRGGSLYAATFGSALFGAVAHNGAATAATIGSITIPWIKRSNASGETAATVLGGNAGIGAVFPFSGAFFLLLAAPTVVGDLSSNDVILTAFVAAFWFLATRVIAAFVMIRARSVGAMDAADIQPLRRTVKAGWSSFTVLVAIAIPILATNGASGEAVTERIGTEAADTIPVLFWLPAAMLIPGLIVGRRLLPKSGRAWWEFLGGVSPKLGLVAATMIAAFSASEVISNLGLGEQLAPLLEQLGDVPAVLAVTIVGALIIVVAGPLSTTGTIAAVGGVGYAALTAVGVAPAAAYAAVLIWGASESASPPGAAPLYVAAGIAEVNPAKTFKPVIMYYLIPTFLLGVLMAVGIAWVP
ncbi:TRAP transporter large permease subunit [Glycomyces tenuis]|uniref:TRAP transporter large permease subunit n=3 Tax=Glycomyces tenuis TaxID=58116 RepID=UPI0004000EEC|nr:TRAP transporter large permease subunit [Glycomyces tenuis]